MILFLRIAVLRSQDSLDWGPDRGRPAGDVLTPGHVAEFRGLYKELIETNTSFSVGSCTLAAERMKARLVAAG